MSFADRLICLALPAVAPLAAGRRTLLTFAHLRSANVILFTPNIFMLLEGDHFAEIAITDVS